MGAQRLSEQKTRRIAATTGLPVIRAWGHGGYIHGFVTADHRHGCYDTRTGEWELGDGIHYSSCSDLFPGYDGRHHCQPGRWFPVIGGQCAGCGQRLASPPARDLDQEALTAYLAANLS